jgi:hypothetical protein
MNADNNSQLAAKKFWLTKMELSQKKAFFSDPARRDTSVSD